MQETKKDNFSSGLVISEEVIATIAANAARDVDGVADLSNRPADLQTAFKIGAEDLKKVAVVLRRSPRRSRRPSKRPSRT